MVISCTPAITLCFILMDFWNFNINQYDDCGCDDLLLSNNELPTLMDGLDQESCNFSTYPSDFLIGMQNPCFDPVDQDPAWSPSNVMSFQAEYPFEELDMTLWDDNLFSNNPSYGHISASIPNSNDQRLLLVSNNGLNKIEKGNDTMIMSSKKTDIEYGEQGMKMPTKRRNYGHMTTDQHQIPNTMQVDQLLVSNSGLNAIEKGNGSMIMGNRKDDIEHVWQGKKLLTGIRSYGDMSTDQYMDQLWLSNNDLNGTEKENYEAMIMTSKKNDIEYGWQGMMLPKGIRNYDHLNADQYSIHNTMDQVSNRGLIANEKINRALIMSKKEGEQYGWQGKKLPTAAIRSYGHMSGANHYSIPNVLDHFLVSSSRLYANEKINGDMIMSSKEDLHGWQGMKMPTEKSYDHVDQNSIPNTNVDEKENEAISNISKKEDEHEWQGMKVEVEARNSTVHRSKVNVESKQRLRSINFEEMSKYFYVPIMQAAREMKVGLTVLKRRCRELGINRWPQRKMKSLDSLIQNVQEMKIKGEGEGSERVDVERLIEHKKMMEKMPEMELTNETKKLRQACFKANFKKRRLMAFGPY